MSISHFVRIFFWDSVLFSNRENENEQTSYFIDNVLVGGNRSPFMEIPECIDLFIQNTFKAIRALRWVRLQELITLPKIY